VAWERFVVDPNPGPRPLGEIRGAEPIADTVALASPDTTTEDGVPLCEARMAGHLGARTVLVDVTRGAEGVAAGLREAARRLDCDVAIYLDVGGDVLADGSEPGLASPLCDAIMLAGAAAATDSLPGAAAVFGAGCDGELTPVEVLARLAAAGRAGAWLGTHGPEPRLADDIEAAAAVVTTEASVMAARCARGETGPTPIRGGRRTVELSPIGALTFFVDPVRAVEAAVAPLAAAVTGTDELEAANDALHAIELRTELDYERGRAAEAA
jgi:hypothetical protein